MSVEWLKNLTPGTLPRDREGSSGLTGIEKAYFQEVQKLKAENAELKKRLKATGE